MRPVGVCRQGRSGVEYDTGVADRDTSFVGIQGRGRGLITARLRLVAIWVGIIVIFVYVVGETRHKPPDCGRGGCDAGRGEISMLLVFVGVESWIHVWSFRESVEEY